MKPTRSLALIVAGGILAAAGATAWFDAETTERVRAQISSSKDGYLLRNLRAAAEANVSIGLTLDQMDGLQGLIEREREGAEDVLSIDVFNGSGVVVYSTDRSAIGTAVATPWVPFLARDQAWTIAGRGERVVGTRFDNDLGVAEGGIALTLKGRGAAAIGDDPLAVLRANAVSLIATLLALLAAAVASARLLQRSTARFRAAAAILSDPEPARTPPAEPLSALASAQAQRWAWIRTTLVERQKALERLDDAS